MDVLDLLKINGGGDVQPNGIDLIKATGMCIYISYPKWLNKGESGTYNWKMKVSS